MAEKEVKNKQLILRDYVSGFLKESDMYLKSDSTTKLKLEQESNGVLVKNLFLAADPHLRVLMNKSESRSVLQSFSPGSVCFFAPYFFSTKVCTFFIFYFCILTSYFQYESCLNTLKILKIEFYLFH